MVNPNWWRSAVIYQIYPRSFKDSSGNGVGDLKGILQKLDYIAALGVDAIWVSPFFKSPMKDFGYDVADYCAIDPLFGTMADFDTLLSAVHERGLKLLIDQVWNHTSDAHPWFQESRRSRDNEKADWYVWADPKPDGSPPNNWLATFGGSAWSWEPQRQQYYLHNFLSAQPDLNWYNPAVIEAILEIARFWLDKGVDGFRLDVVNFFRHDRQLRDNPARSQITLRPDGAAPSDPFFSYLNLYNFCQPETLEVLEPLRQCFDSYPGTTTLAEISSAEDTLLTSSQYVGERRLHMAYNSSLMTEEPLTQQRMYRLIQRVEQLFGENVLCWTAGTHDFPRLKSRWRRFHQLDEFNQNAFDHMLIALLLCLRGSCCIYQGDELGLAQAEIPYEKMQDPFGLAGYPQVLGRDGSRTPMPWEADRPQAGFTSAAEPWLPIPTEHLANSVDKQTDDANSLLNKYRQLIHWRKQQPALQQGSLKLIETAPPILGFTRSCAEQSLVCLFNLSPEVAYFDMSAFEPCQLDE
ncbi:MAG: alpha-glucosidase, partial [Leptolyngbya sp. SIO4C1]|nr:alpha-glucosidase [Leptolyngbya sp. SIO4C1]